MFGAFINILVIFLLMFMVYWLSQIKWFNNQTADQCSKPRCDF